VVTSSSVQRAKQDLANRLKDIRVTAGLTATALAEAAGWHRTKVSKLENLNTSFSAEDIRTWCRVSGLPGQAEDLVAALLATDSMWTEWKRMERTGLKRAQESVLPLWETTRRFRIYSPWLAPGPVQHESYIRALLTATVPDPPVRSGELFVGEGPGSGSRSAAVHPRP
jgi:transcriptional regulator with XRE-family HTH domain